MPSFGNISPELSNYIQEVIRRKENGKEKCYAIMKLYPSVEANSTDHNTVRGKPISKFEVNEIKEMARRFNNKEAHWPLYSFFEHKQTPKTFMGQVTRMWYNEKDKWMNAEVELNSAETADFILKENLGCSLCLARTGDSKKLIEFSFVRKGNLVNSEVTTVYRNSAETSTDQQDLLFPPTHEGVVHFIPLTSGPWIERNTATPTMENQPTSTDQSVSEDQETSSSVEKVAGSSESMEDDASFGVDDDIAAFDSLSPEEQQQMKRVLLLNAHEGEALKRKNEELSKQMAEINAERNRAERERQIASHMDLARKMITELKQGDRPMKDEDCRVLAEEFAELSNNEDTSLFMGLLQKQQEKIDNLHQELENQRLVAKKSERDSTHSSDLSNQKEIFNALEKAQVYPKSIQQNMQNPQPAKRQVTGGSRLFRSLLNDSAHRAPLTGNNGASNPNKTPLMDGMKKRANDANNKHAIEAHSAENDEDDQESLIQKLVEREKMMANRANKRKIGDAGFTTIEANSSAESDDPYGDSQYATSEGTNVIPFLRQRGLLGGVEGDIRNESLNRAGTSNNVAMVIEAHSAEIEDFVVQNIPRRKNGEGTTRDELRNIMYEDIAHAVDRRLREGKGERLNQSMLLKDPSLFNYIVDLHLAPSDETPTNASFGLVDKARFDQLSPTEREEGDYWFFNHPNFHKAQTVASDYQH